MIKQWLCEMCMSFYAMTCAYHHSDVMVHVIDETREVGSHIVHIRNEEQLLGDLMNLLYKSGVKKEKDKWNWVLESTNIFEVKPLYVSMSGKFLYPTDF